MMMSYSDPRQILPWGDIRGFKYKTSVAAGFGRHGMPPSAFNDTCTALGQEG